MKKYISSNGGERLIPVQNVKHISRRFGHHYVCDLQGDEYPITRFEYEEIVASAEAGEIVTPALPGQTVVAVVVYDAVGRDFEVHDAPVIAWVINPLTRRSLPVLSGGWLNDVPLAIPLPDGTVVCQDGEGLFETKADFVESVIQREIAKSHKGASK